MKPVGDLERVRGSESGTLGVGAGATRQINWTPGRAANHAAKEAGVSAGH
ncbi:hypothetical protein [Streptomyces canus]|nr:hypothetical protein [Streptomyces canus]